MKDNNKFSPCTLDHFMSGTRIGMALGVFPIPVLISYLNGGWPYILLLLALCLASYFATKHVLIYMQLGLSSKRSEFSWLGCIFGFLVSMLYFFSLF